MFGRDSGSRIVLYHLHPHTLRPKLLVVCISVVHLCTKPKHLKQTPQDLHFLVCLVVVNEAGVPHFHTSFFVLGFDVMYIMLFLLVGLVWVRRQLQSYMSSIFMASKQDFQRRVLLCVRMCTLAVHLLTLFMHSSTAMFSVATSTHRKKILTAI